MITDCGGGIIRYFLHLDQSAFFVDVLTLLIMATPVTIGYILWTTYLTNRASFRVRSVLRLDENSELYTESCDRGISWLTLFVYAVTVEVFAFELFLYLQKLLT